MVAFRLLCRRYGAQLAYSPMVHSRIYLETRETSPETLEENIVSTPEDRPFFIQVLLLIYFAFRGMMERNTGERAV